LDGDCNSGINIFAAFYPGKSKISLCTLEFEQNLAGLFVLRIFVRTYFGRVSYHRGKDIIYRDHGLEKCTQTNKHISRYGREKLVDVLGVTEEIPASYARETPTFQSVVGDYENLSLEDRESVKIFICEP
jgi:hypothetical protein